MSTYVFRLGCNNRKSMTHTSSWRPDVRHGLQCGLIPSHLIFLQCALTMSISTRWHWMASNPYFRWHMSHALLYLPLVPGTLTIFSKKRSFFPASFMSWVVVEFSSVSQKSWRRKVFLVPWGAFLYEKRTNNRNWQGSVPAYYLPQLATSGRLFNDTRWSCRSLKGFAIPWITLPALSETTIGRAWP